MIFARRHSQIRTTVQPRSRKRRFVRRSRALFVLIFLRHASLFVFGVMFFPQSCPCQKHPSTKTATLATGHAKSGLPGIRGSLRHPLSLYWRSKHASRPSVVLLPTESTRAMSLPRDRSPNVVRSFLESPGQVLIARSREA